MFSIISLFPTAFIFGFSYYPAKDEYKYEEINLYLGVIHLQYRWG